MVEGSGKTSDLARVKMYFNLGAASSLPFADNRCERKLKAYATPRIARWKLAPRPAFPLVFNGPSISYSEREVIDDANFAYPEKQVRPKIDILIVTFQN